LQSIDYNELARNRDWLINFQKENWINTDPKAICLHLGSGHLKLPGFIDIDKYTKEADLKADITDLPFEENSVSRIVCHHVIEHLPIHSTFKMLKHWYKILQPGGILDLGLPDIEMCAQTFLNSPEDQKWSWNIFTLLGAQTEPEDVGPRGLNIRDDFPFNAGQVHMGGFSMGVFIRMLEDIGFKISDGKFYDGMGTPSFFIYAYKPEQPKSLGTILEQDCCIGVFTNKITYIKDLWKSCQKFIPHVQFITRINRGSINLGMEILRQDFIKSGKRYWVFMDDDILILNSDIIKNALETLVNGKYGIVGVYSTFKPESITQPYDANGLESRVYNGFIPGYFMCVDSQKVRMVEPDLNLPDSNTSIDTSYCCSVRAKGYDLGISADYVYHVDKGVMANTGVIDITNQYLMNKWGNYYFSNSVYDGCVIEWKI
jgi:SAM-dependent methyltransferase